MPARKKTASKKPSAKKKAAPRAQADEAGILERVTGVLAQAVGDGRVLVVSAVSVGAGIIGTCDFQDPNLETLLNAMLRMRNFRGIRAERERLVPSSPLCAQRALLSEHK